MGLVWGIEYELAPGEYVRYGVRGRVDDLELFVDVVRVDGVVFDVVGRLAVARLSFRDLLALPKKTTCPKSLKAFIKSVPLRGVGYVPDPRRTYPPGEVGRVADFIDRLRTRR